MVKRGHRPGDFVVERGDCKPVNQFMHLPRVRIDPHRDDIQVRIAPYGVCCNLKDGGTAEHDARRLKERDEVFGLLPGIFPLVFVVDRRRGAARFRAG